MTIENKVQLIIDTMDIDGFEERASDEAKHVINLYASVAAELGHQVKALTEEIERLKNK
jgi:uncharacterized small protein (DUF1192 family)